MNALENEFADTSSPTTGLDVLDEYANRDVIAHITLAHDALPALRFVATVPRNGVEAAQLAEKAAKREKVAKPEDLPVAVFARWQLAALVTEIHALVGETWERVEIDGDPMSFVAPELKARLKATSAADAVWRLIKDDGIIQALVGQLSKASNFSRDAEVVDPT